MNKQMRLQSNEVWEKKIVPYVIFSACFFPTQKILCLRVRWQGFFLYFLKNIVFLLKSPSHALEGEVLEGKVPKKGLWVLVRKKQLPEAKKQQQLMVWEPQHPREGPEPRADRTKRHLRVGRMRQKPGLGEMSDDVGTRYSPHVNHWVPERSTFPFVCLGGSNQFQSMAQRKEGDWTEKKSTWNFTDLPEEKVLRVAIILKFYRFKQNQIKIPFTKPLTMYLEYTLVLLPTGFAGPLVPVQWLVCVKSSLRTYSKTEDTSAKASTAWPSLEDVQDHFQLDQPSVLCIIILLQHPESNFSLFNLPENWEAVVLRNTPTKGPWDLIPCQHFNPRFQISLRCIGACTSPLSLPPLHDSLRCTLHHWGTSYGTYHTRCGPSGLRPSCAAVHQGWQKACSQTLKTTILILLHVHIRPLSGP